MPRPTRIEYEGAFHHVMNRGRNHENIFHDKRYFDEFLKCLKEASEQFDAVIQKHEVRSFHAINKQGHPLIKKVITINSRLPDYLL